MYQLSGSVQHIESLTRGNIRAVEEESLALMSTRERRHGFVQLRFKQVELGRQEPKLTIHATNGSDDAPIFVPTTRRVGFVKIGAASSEHEIMAFLQDRLTRCCYSLCQRFVRRTGLLSSAHLKRCSPPHVNLPLVPIGFLTVCTGRLAVSALNFPVLPRSGAHGGGSPGWLLCAVFILNSGDTDARGLLIRTPEALRPLILRNCDC